MAGVVEKVGNRRWGIGVLLAVGVLVNYLDRISISVAAPQLQKELSLSSGQIGLLLSAFFWSYSLAQLPAAGPFRRHAGWPDRRLPVDDRLDPDGAVHWLSRHLRCAHAAWRGRGTRHDQLPEGDRLLVSPP